MGDRAMNDVMILMLVFICTANSVSLFFLSLSIEKIQKKLGIKDGQ